jgi:CRP/FNR family transcriptional regulator, cyclic AMP receptor protein
VRQHGYWKRFSNPIEDDVDFFLEQSARPCSQQDRHGRPSQWTQCLCWRVYQGGGGDFHPRALTAWPHSGGRPHKRRPVSRPKGDLVATRKSGEMSDNEVDFSLLLRPELPTRFFAKGDTIFSEGERGDEFFVVVRGQVEIRSDNRRLETLGRSGIFGEMALIDDRPRSATVAALTDVTVAPIKEKQFLFLVKHMPMFALSVMRVLAYRLRRQNKAV